jgi:poly-gamma-glutamate synthesis protein (capsule biosynthesis protein)
MVPATGLADGFVLRAVGDCILPFPIAARAATDPAIASVVDLLRSATLTLGNLETSIVDLHGDASDLAPRVVDDWCLSATPEVAEDLVAMGFDVMARANNHAMDWGPGGMRETARRLDEAGLAHAGTGERLAAARAPVYLDTTHGRVGVISVYTTRRFDPDGALDPFGTVPGRPGVNALRLQRVVTAPADAIALIRGVVRVIDPDEQVTAEGEDLRLDDSRFVEGSSIAVTYEPDPTDLAEIVRAVRLGARHADLLVVTVHAHEEGPDAATPPAYLQAFARACVDAGAGLFVGHGVHRQWPVERYRERLICYGVGNFVFSDVQEPVHEAMHRYAGPRLPAGLPVEHVTDADVNAAALGPFFDDDRYFQAVLVELEARGGELHPRLVPLDLRRVEPLTVRGLPSLASPDVAAQIVERLNAMSRPFGTVVDANGQVPAASVAPEPQRS